MQATFIVAPSGERFWLTPGQTVTWMTVRRYIGRKRSFTISMIARETNTSRGRCFMRLQRLRSLGLIGFRPLRRGRRGRTFAWRPKCSAPNSPRTITAKAERGYARWWASVNGAIRPRRGSPERAGDVMAWLVSQLLTRNLA